MGADLFQQYLRPPRSIQSYMDEADQRDMRREQMVGLQRQNALAALAAQATLEETQQRIDRDKELSGLMSRPDLQGNPLGIEQAALMNPRLAEWGEKRRQARVTADEMAAKGRHASAQADEIGQKMRMADRMKAIQAIGGMDRPEDVVAYLNSPSAAGIDMAERTALIRTFQSVDPSRFAIEQARAALRLVAPVDQVKALQPEFVSVGDMMVNKNQLSGPIGRAGQTIKIGQSPDNAATVEATLQGNRLADRRGWEQITETKRHNQAMEEAAKDKKESSKPLPPTALKLQNEHLQSLGAFQGLDADLQGIENQIAKGDLKLSLLGNIVRTIMNRVGVSTEQSRNLATLKTTLEGMRNAILMAARGVQTEGDAVRAMDQIIANINDEEYVKQRIPELSKKLERDANLQRAAVEFISTNYGRPVPDMSKFDTQPAATDLPKPSGGLTPAEQRELEDLRRRFPRGGK